jgi:hypothetical protein
MAVFEALNPNSGEPPAMRRLIVNGDPGIRKDGIIDYDDEEYVCFGVARQGEWHGPDRVQLWCTIGTEDEREDFERRNFIPMHLEVDDIDADALDVIKAKGDLAV